ncbi:ROK family transcriptional regulator [candidate division KSB1 bacterium]|nr:ROK family transcriptional regulator [candidate division KSB1 bacterium]
MIQNLQKNLTQNELRVFRAIYETELISRVKISKELNLTRAAVSGITKRLVGFGLIHEVGKGSAVNGRGRREVLLSINPSAGYIISIHFALSYCSFGIVNLKGNILDKITRTFPLGTAPHDVLKNLDQEIFVMLEKNGIGKDKIYGVGTAIPGIVQQDEGKVCEITLKDWQGFPLRDYLEKKLGFEVYIENDVKTITLGEYQFGISKHVRNMVCLWFEDGIGAGIINDGRLIRGVTSSAGEIGFNEFIMDLPRKKSILFNGKPKYLGDILCFTNLKETIKRGLREGWNSQLTDKSDIEDFINAVESGDPLGLYVIRLLGKVLGVLCANLTYSFNPQILLLAGPLFYRLPQLVDEIKTYFNRCYLRSPINSVELKTSVLGEDGITIGSVALIFEQLFKTELN